MGDNKSTPLHSEEKKSSATGKDTTDIMPQKDASNLANIHAIKDLLGSGSDNSIGNVVARIKLKDQVQEMVAEHIKAPFNVETPEEKVKKRPDGYDYVESSFMDHVFKEFSPLYEYQLLEFSIQLGWIVCVISLRDRITGNTEIGADAARIMVKKDAPEPSFKDVIDLGNNVKSAISKAIKNAQSRFGVAADVYQKRESVPTDEERKRFKDILTRVKNVAPSKSGILEDQWNNLGTDWSEFLDAWESHIQKLEAAKTKTSGSPLVSSIKSDLGGKEISNDTKKISL